MFIIIITFFDDVEFLLFDQVSIANFIIKVSGMKSVMSIAICRIMNFFFKSPVLYIIMTLK